MQELSETFQSKYVKALDKLKANDFVFVRYQSVTTDVNLLRSNPASSTETSTAGGI